MRIIHRHSRVSASRPSYFVEKAMPSKHRGEEEEEEEERKGTANNRLQRPSPLMINNNSKPIRKHPVIIYTQSPKVIHTKPQDFMAVVQRLTGRKDVEVDDVMISSEDKGSKAEPDQFVSANNSLFLSPNHVHRFGDFLSLSPSSSIYNVKREFIEIMK